MTRSPSTCPEGTAYLLHTAGAIGRRETTAGGTTAKRLLEEAMLPSNLAAQWHDHARTSPSVSYQTMMF